VDSVAGFRKDPGDEHELIEGMKSRCRNGCNAPPCLESLFLNVGVRTTLNDEALYVAILPLRMDNTPAAFESHNPAVKFR
jgi:hypothetical protein